MRQAVCEGNTMVYITGDCHADFRRFATKRFQDQKEMTRDDIMIVCGDFGIWHNDSEERHNLKWLDGKPFTTVFVDGNHENFDRLYSDEFPVVEFHGGKAHRIMPNIYHLMRGEMFTFDGKRFFCFGGASSHDIRDGILDPDDFESVDAFYAVYKQWSFMNRMFRVNHLSWWKQELPTQEELDHGWKTLEDNNFETDFIVSHCCPQEVASVLGFRESDNLTSWFNEVAHKTKFEKWHFGHYHDETKVYGKFVLHYTDIERIV